MKKHPYTKINKNRNREVTLSKFYVVSKSQRLKPLFKVTKRCPVIESQNTMFFTDKRLAEKQFKEWSKK